MHWLLIAVAMAVAGCCEPASDLVFLGEPMPADTTLVLAVAQEYSDRSIVGTFEWRVEGERTGVDGAGFNTGRCYREAAGCPLVAWSTVPYGEHAMNWSEAVEGGDCETEPLRSSAICSSMAHEIGHWVLQTSDEDSVNDWAATVNATALHLRRDASPSGR